jgi:hypothetical protein
MQTRPMVVPLRRGDAVIFAVHHRPVKGTRGSYRVNLRHGVSKLLSGQRYTVRDSQRAGAHLRRAEMWRGYCQAGAWIAIYGEAVADRGWV